MRIRLEGSLQELEIAIEALRRSFEIGAVSKPYKNRNSDQFRVYVNAVPVPPAK